jgi:EAL domain-containing protein (putative c-di-GMP-specific phosphodiesterase class I)
VLAPGLERRQILSSLPTVESRAWLDRLRIRPFFQPILDLTSGQPLGYEILSRGTAPYGSPDVMFRVARELDLLWDLEYACRAAAIQGIAALPATLRGPSFFLNVSPQVLSDSRFVKGFTLGMLRESGLAQDDLVIEITERESIHDYGRFEALIRHYVAQGFRISLDDFGSGHSSLVTLTRCVPHFIKLDRAIVHQLERTPYKQQLVKALVAFCASVGATLIAEGVETWDELETLVAFGVRNAQGFLLARPLPVPAGLEPAIGARLSRVLQQDAGPRA